MPPFSMQINIEFDAKGLFRAFKKFPKETSKEIRVAMKTGLENLARSARLKKYHRFDSKSTNLERAIQAVVDKSGLSGKVWIDPDISGTRTKKGPSYGLYIHEGFKSWAPDQFIYKAADAHEVKLKNRLQDAIDKAIKNAGLA